MPTVSSMISQGVAIGACAGGVPSQRQAAGPAAATTASARSSAAVGP